MQVALFGDEIEVDHFWIWMQNLPKWKGKHMLTPKLNDPLINLIRRNAKLCAWMQVPDFFLNNEIEVNHLWIEIKTCQNERESIILPFTFQHSTQFTSGGWQTASLSRKVDLNLGLSMGTGDPCSHKISMKLMNPRLNKYVRSLDMTQSYHCTWRKHRLLVEVMDQYLFLTWWYTTESRTTMISSACVVCQVTPFLTSLYHPHFCSDVTWEQRPYFPVAIYVPAFTGKYSGEVQAIFHCNSNYHCVVMFAYIL